MGVGRGPIGLVAPWRSKTLDSQPGKCNMGPVSIDVHDFQLFQKRCHGFLARYLWCFRPDRRKVVYSSFSVGTKKMRGQKLCRFVVVSPREVHFSFGLCHFKFSDFRSFFEGSVVCPVSVLPRKCSLNLATNRMTALALLSMLMCSKTEGGAKTKSLQQRSTRNRDQCYTTCIHSAVALL